MLKRLIGADQPVAFGLSLEELWKLFPIELKEYDPQYSKWYKEIKNELVAILGDSILRISHIGSTAVEGLLSKPIIDILLEIKHQDAVGGKGTLCLPPFASIRLPPPAGAARLKCKPRPRPKTDLVYIRS